jgi:predicted SAM-dependent methyltransferase
MRKAIGSALDSLHLRGIALTSLRHLTLVERMVSSRDTKLVRDYLAEHDVRKLHLGCGSNLLDGWLNSDYFPRSSRVLSLDATARFPFEAGQFDYIFSEHMIEHIPYAGGESMLRECHRVLKPGGVLRISTPDLSFLLDLGRGQKSDLQQDYIDWSTREFVAGAPYADEVFVINNFMRDWGHVFIYDEKTLQRSLNHAGFDRTARCDLNQSTEPQLCGLENEQRLPTGFLKLETMTFEARK